MKINLLVSNDSLMENKSCLFVVVFGTIREVIAEDNGPSGLAIDIGEEESVPIADLTRPFTSLESPKMAGKPKIWLFLDSGTSTDSCSSKKASA